MPDPFQDGMKSDVNNLREQVGRLWESRASKESVENVNKSIDDIKKSVDGLGTAFRHLQTSILVGCVLWALGSAGFLIGILEFART